ncbi:hypothetical protein ACFFRR_000243 [Megaselia abdita]
MGKKPLTQFPFTNISVTVTLLCLYLAIVFIVAKRFMRDRPAYKLKTFMVFYNIYQIVICVFSMKLILDTGVKFWGAYCPEVDTLDDSVLYSVGNLTYWIKVSEMVETVVFVLRRKEKQITNLHVYHHCVTLIIVYFIIVNGFRSGWFFGLFINCFVHVLMYSYYLLCALFGEMKFFLWLKKAVTSFQILQFAVVVTQLIMHQIMGCSYSKYLAAFLMSQYLIFLYLFCEFFVRAYWKRRVN